MASEKEMVAAFEKIQADVPGFIAASLVDLDSGMTLAVKSVRADFDLAATIYPGKLTKRPSFRIGTIGQIDERVIAAVLEAIREVMSEMGVKDFAPIAR